MESGKQGGSESSSEENDGIDQQVKDIDMSSTKRSYECSFCKRGFTNAQALGGHMNIHRKDRVKAPKQHTTGPSFSNYKSDEDNIPCSFISVPVPCDPSNYNFPAFEAQKNSQIMYFQPSSASGSRHPQAETFRQSTDLSDSRSQSWSMNQELLNANLSLRIGPMHADHQEDRRKRPGVNKTDEVDLELRLGHDPY